MLSEINKGLKTWHNLPCTYIERLNIFEMEIFLKMIYRFNAISVRISGDFFIEIGKLFQKFIWDCTASKIAKTISKSTEPERLEVA